MQEQIKKYVTCYCASNLKLAEVFMAHLNIVPGLVYLSVVPLYLAILVRLFKADRQLPQRLTDLCNDFLTVCLQHHKEKFYGTNSQFSALINYQLKCKVHFIVCRNVLMNNLYSIPKDSLQRKKCHKYFLIAEVCLTILMA